MINAKDSETMVCRCEDVTRQRVHECIADGYTRLDEIKRVTRAGMGPCQGRTCRHLIATELSRVCHIPMEEVIMTTFRPPVKPIALGALADAYADRQPGLSAEAAPDGHVTVPDEQAGSGGQVAVPGAEGEKVAVGHASYSAGVGR